MKLPFCFWPYFNKNEGFRRIPTARIEVAVILGKKEQECRKQDSLPKE
ncbi:hypothetical protein B932_3444 [Gluconobacter oxydans H24]|nr:hypothetical protein B932_3444 [Gluconobacter oxydans H24]